MKNNIETAKELKSVIDYILWNYNENVGNIADKLPTVIVQDLSNVWMVRINYIGEIRKGNTEIDPILQTDDEPVMTDWEFHLLKKESFRQLTKYVEDICEEINKIELEA